MSARRAGFSLVVDGIDYAKEIVPRLIRLSLTEKLGEAADELEIELSNHDGALKPIKRGVYASLSLGWLEGEGVKLGLIDKGRFMVDEVEKSGPPDTLRIKARSADLTGDYRKRKDKGWKDTTLGAVLQDIAGANGLKASIHADLAGIALPSIEQAAKSDAAFVRDLGARYDAVATVKDGTLIFLPIGASANASGQVFTGATLIRQNNSRWSFTIPDREQHDGAEARWHDKRGAKGKTVKVGGGKNAKRIKRSFASEAEAKQAAAAQARKAARGEYQFSYQMALGDPGLEPNQPVTLDGWDSEIDAVKWLISEASHSLDKGGGLASSVKLESVV
ncbi:contractile injection system protein, VgrG/Pvc8 family [Altererythrobacter fulvus]|uniref:contractile injection system protein, VgrG/Pvc8 family n=1 Tax=Caenibius fulvus TaxID=2126012 RepID=UPI003017FE35